MSTKRYEGPIEVGMRFIHCSRGPGTITRIKDGPFPYAMTLEDGYSDAWTEEVFRGGVVFTPAPAAPRERVLAMGWHKCAKGSRHCKPCDSWTAEYVRGQPGESVGPDRRACAVHAEAMGAFADKPADAPAVKPCADWCGTIGGCGGSNYCRGFGLEAMCCCDSPVCRGKAADAPPPVPVAKPAPRAWVHQVEEAAKTAGRCPYSDWAALQTGVATNLDSEKSPATRHRHPGIAGPSYGPFGIWSRGGR